MNLPFSHQEFIDVFVLFNQDNLWLVIVLWLVTLAAVFVLSFSTRLGRLFLTAVLALHWLCSGFVYHIGYFSDINPAAYGFGILFVVQAFIIIWRGLVKKSLDFSVSKARWNLVGLGIVLYGLIYPALGLLIGNNYPALPLFAVPCPTTIITLGCSLLLPKRESIWLGALPILWVAIGGSAAFLFNIVQDFGLLVAGVLTLMYWLVGKSE